jgi:hypothetical protein
MKEPVLLQSPGQLGTELSRRKTELTTTAQLLIFEPGLYSVDFRAKESGTTDVGLRLPCIRLESVPSEGNAGRLFVSVSSEGGWISASTDAVFVLVTGGRAAAVLTIYRASDGMPAPEIRIRALLRDTDLSAGAAREGVAMPPRLAAEMAAPVAEEEETPGAVPVQFLVHVTGTGDIQQSGGSWAISPGNAAPIEGFAVAALGLDLKDVEYQAILGQDWKTPWYGGGEFCGSRGMALPLRGFCLRLTGNISAAYDCKYWGSFGAKGIVGPVMAGDVCESNGAPLTSLRVEIVPRHMPAAGAVALPESESDPTLTLAETRKAGTRKQRRFASPGTAKVVEESRTSRKRKVPSGARKTR